MGDGGAGVGDGGTLRPGAWRRPALRWCLFKPHRPAAPEDWSYSITGRLRMMSLGARRGHWTLCQGGDATGLAAPLAHLRPSVRASKVRRQVAASVRESELLRRFPTPSRPGSSHFGPDPPVSSVQLSVHRNPGAQGCRGHSEVRLLLSFHLFLCLNVPACDDLQCPFHLGTLPMRRALHSCTGPLSHPGAKEWPTPGSWQRFKGFEGLRADQGKGVERDCRGRGG